PPDRLLPERGADGPHVARLRHPTVASPSASDARREIGPVAARRRESPGIAYPPRGDPLVEITPPGRAPAAEEDPAARDPAARDSNGREAAEEPAAGRRGSRRAGSAPARRAARGSCRRAERLPFRRPSSGAWEEAAARERARAAAPRRSR